MAILKNKIKNPPKSKAFDYSDLCRHISIIGGALMIMVTPMPADAKVAEKKKRE